MKELHRVYVGCSVAPGTRRGEGDALADRARLVPRRIRGSVLVKDRHGRRVSYARGETQNADQPGTSHRTHPWDTHLRTRELVYHFCADYIDLGHAVYGAASTVEFDRALDCRCRNEPAVFCLRTFSRTGAQRGRARVQNTSDFDHAFRFRWSRATWSRTVQTYSGIQRCDRWANC